MDDMKYIWGMPRIKWNELSDNQKEEHIHRAVLQYELACRYEAALSRKRKLAKPFVDCYPHIIKTGMDTFIPTTNDRFI